MAIDKETYRFLASLFPGVAGFSPNVNAQQYGLRPDEEYFDMESGRNLVRTGNWSSREGMEAYETELARQLYLAQVPEELRRAVEGGIGPQGIVYGEGDRAMGINPLTGRPEGLSRVTFDYRDEGPTGGPGYGKDIVLPTSLVDQYFPRRSDSNAYQTGWVQKEMAPDDTFLDKIMPIVASLPAGFGAGGALSGYLGGGLTGKMGAGAIMSTLTGGNPIIGAAMGGLGSMLPGSTTVADGGAMDMGIGLDQMYGSGSWGAPSSFQVAQAGVSDVPQGLFTRGDATSGMWDADMLDRSLIGPDAGALPGSGSQFAPPLPVPQGTQQQGGQKPQGPQMPPAVPGTGVPTDTGGGILDGLKSLSPYAPLLGMAAGGLLGATSGGGEAGKITVEEGIPDWLMPYVKPSLDKYATEVQNYQVDPYGVMPAAMQQFKDTVSGMYLDPSTNKWLEEYYKLGAERIKGTLSPSFGHMQAFGSHSGYNEALSRGLGDFATGLYGGNYAKERDRQTQMTASAPNFLTQSTTSAFAPYTQYLSAVGNLGKKKDQPYFEPSMFQNILGGGMMGYGLGKIFS